ncbi:MAG: Ig-like domain-containing protein [Bacteroidota bacterium]
MQKLLLYICIVLLCTQCAQITPLTGGKKDDTPPKALSYKPENASLNFSTKVIEVQFDEYIVLKDVNNQFIITPQTKEMPEIEASGKKLRIVFNETLLPNTTYKLAFGNAITDLNESNALQNFEYIFSTGSTIDSLKLSGQIFSAIDKKPVSQVLVGLYSADANDSIIYKEKPLYISKTIEGGSFSFNYLPDSKFKVVGIRDQNKNLLYDGSEEQVAFANNPVSAKDSGNISLLLFKEIPVKSFVKKSFQSEAGKAYIIFNKPQIDISTVRAQGLVHYMQNISKDTLVLYYADKFDTLQAFVDHGSGRTDTVLIKLPSQNTLKKQNTSLKYTMQVNMTTVLPFYMLPSFELNYPVDGESILESKIILIEKADTILRQLPFTIIADSGSITSFIVKADIKPETSYTLTILKDALNFRSQRSNDSITYKFKTTSVDDYAQLNMKLLLPEKENYLIQLLNDKEQIVDERVVELSLTSTSEKIIAYKNLIPGNYFMKVVEDANKNGLFDMGDYFLHKQPEVIFVNQLPIKLLAGWEIENEWIVK